MAIHHPDLSRVVWRKSTYSGGNGSCVEVADVRVVWRKSTDSGGNGDCVEVADLRRAVAVRDSKNPTGGALRFSPDEWKTFLQSVRAASDS
jgi:Domain of unknown function (DUF397)